MGDALSVTDSEDRIVCALTWDWSCQLSRNFFVSPVARSAGVQPSFDIAPSHRRSTNNTQKDENTDDKKWIYTHFMCNTYIN